MTASLPRPVARSVRLDRLVADLPDVVVHGGLQIEVTGVELDSRLVQPGDLFAALPGHHAHGAQFAPTAIERGALAILTDAEGWAQLASVVDPAQVPVIVVPGTRARLGLLAARVYGHPAADLMTFAVTGTNGKTTVTTMIDAGLRAAGHVTGIIGTVGVRIGDVEWPSSRTTPESVHLHGLLARMRDAGVSDVSVEVSSHAICEGRVDGITFDIAGFTQLTQDHLDYHGTMEAYFEAKAQLFTPAHASRGIVGIDDAWGRRLAQGASIPIQTWSLGGRAADWTLHREGAESVVHGPDGELQPLRVALPGEFNRANALLAYAMLRSAGIDADSAARGIASVTVPGRMESVGEAGGVVGIVDYAHSPDSIERVLEGIRPDVRGRIIVVLGAGGDRDRDKRPQMGSAAARGADVVIVTDDNPRSEDPDLIRRAVLHGALEVSAADSVRVVPDRRAAISEAVATARSGDVVVLLGKGHEQGQEVAGVMHPFDDRVELRAALDQRARA